jgi:hypothetical protein
MGAKSEYFSFLCDEVNDQNQLSLPSSKQSEQEIDDFAEEVEEAILGCNDDPDRVSNTIMNIFSMKIDRNKDFLQVLEAITPAILKNLTTDNFANTQEKVAAIQNVILHSLIINLEI